MRLLERHTEGKKEQIRERERDGKREREAGNKWTKDLVGGSGSQVPPHPHPQTTSFEFLSYAMFNSSVGLSWFKRAQFCELQK